MLEKWAWSERRDSNSGPPVPQTGALTGLRYAPPRRVYDGGTGRASTAKGTTKGPTTGVNQAGAARAWL
jgi:hypothetical protein